MTIMLPSHDTFQTVEGTTFTIPGVVIISIPDQFTPSQTLIDLIINNKLYK